VTGKRLSASFAVAALLAGCGGTSKQASIATRSTPRTVTAPIGPLTDIARRLNADGYVVGEPKTTENSGGTQTLQYEGLSITAYTSPEAAEAEHEKLVAFSKTDPNHVITYIDGAILLSFAAPHRIDNQDWQRLEKIVQAIKDDVGPKLVAEVVVHAPPRTKAAEEAEVAGSASTTPTSSSPPAEPSPSSAPLAEGPGSSSHSQDAAFCASHECIPSFPEGNGTVVQCQDGEWSHSGGVSGACSGHGGTKE
jgi:hypothetical protein